MHKYRLISKKGEGTFSEVLKAQSIKTGRYVAIKCMKNHFESIDQVNNLREIQALRRLSPHPHIIKLCEVLYDEPTGRLALVFELMDMNMYEAIRGRRHYLQESKVKWYMWQLIKSMDHMHRNGIFHRDIKPENILMIDDVIKLADFGSCRGIYSKQPYTEYISTRWYRAPECLLTDGYYNYKMDMWGVGCVFFEIMALFPLFPGTNELDQIQKIHNILGTPPEEVLAKFKAKASHIDFNFPQKDGSGIARLLPHATAECIELIGRLLAYNPDDRLSARQALKHPYFKDLRDAEKAALSLANTQEPRAKPARGDRDREREKGGGGGEGERDEAAGEKDGKDRGAEKEKEKERRRRDEKERERDKDRDAKGRDESPEKEREKPGGDQEKEKDRGGKEGAEVRRLPAHNSGNTEAGRDTDKDRERDENAVHERSTRRDRDRERDEKVAANSNTNNNADALPKIREALPLLNPQMEKEKTLKDQSHTHYNRSNQSLAPNDRDGDAHSGVTGATSNLGHSNAHSHNPHSHSHTHAHQSQPRKQQSYEAGGAHKTHGGGHGGAHGGGGGPSLSHTQKLQPLDRGGGHGEEDEIGGGPSGILPPIGGGKQSSLGQNHGQGGGGGGEKDRERERDKDRGATRLAAVKSQKTGASHAHRDRDRDREKGAGGGTTKPFGGSFGANGQSPAMTVYMGGGGRNGANDSGARHGGVPVPASLMSATLSNFPSFKHHQQSGGPVPLGGAGGTGALSSLATGGNNGSHFAGGGGGGGGGASQAPSYVHMGAGGKRGAGPGLILPTALTSTTTMSTNHPHGGHGGHAYPLKGKSGFRHGISHDSVEGGNGAGVNQSGAGGGGGALGASPGGGGSKYVSPYSQKFLVRSRAND